MSASGYLVSGHTCMAASPEGVFVDALIQERVQSPPGEEAARELGLPEGVPMPHRWQLRTIRASIPGLAGYSLSGVWYACRRAGIRLRAARPHPYSPDPDYAAKNDRLLAVLAEAAARPEEVVVVFLDEMGFMRWPQPAPTFAPGPPSSPPRTQPAGRETKSRIGGMLDPLTGRVLYVEHQRVGRERLLQLYRKLDRAYPRATRIYVVQDNWSVHAHEEITTYLETVSRIQRVWLPISAYWLNPIEKLWRKLRQELLRLHAQATDWTALRQAVCTFLDQFAEGSRPLLRDVGLLGDGLLASTLRPTTDLNSEK
jgi:transposase